MDKKQKLELTWIGKDKRPRLELRAWLDDAAKSDFEQLAMNRMIP